MPTKDLCLKWLRRQRRWLIALGVLLAIRVALPSILRRVAESQASQNLNAEVRIGDVDLGLLAGSIVLEEVTVSARPGEGAPPLPPLISWKRFAVGLRWLPLFRKTVQLWEVSLESPQISLERLKNGDLNLLLLLPKSEAPSAPPPAAAPPASAWQLGADRIALHHGVLRFTDHTLRQSEPVEVAIDSIEVAEIALAPGVYGEPSRIHVDLKVDDSVIRVDARFARHDRGVFLETKLSADRFPLRRTHLYIPRVGWSDLQGELVADLSYHLDSGQRDELRGTIGLNQVTVHAPGVERPALGWRTFSLEIESVDLLARKAMVPSIRLDGAAVLLRTSGGHVLPVMAPVEPEPSVASPGETPDVPAAAAAQAPTPPAEPTPSSAAATQAAPPPPDPAAEPEGTPWQWLVHRVDLGDSSVHVLSDPPLDVSVTAQAREVSSDGGAVMPLQIKLGIGDGTIGFDGEIRQLPLGLQGRLQIEALDLSSLLRAGALTPPPIDSGRLTTDLSLGVGSLAPQEDAIQVDGTLDLADLHVHPSADTLSLRGERLEIALSPLSVRGVLPGSPERTGDLSLRGSILLEQPRVEAIPGSPLAVAARKVQLDLNDVQLKRLLADPTTAAATDDEDARISAVLGVEAPAVTMGSASGNSINADKIELGLRNFSARGLRSGATGDGGRVQAEGRLLLSKLAVNGPDPKQFSVGAKVIDLPFDSVQALGFLPGRATSRRLDVRLGAVRLDQPAVRVTRTKDGIVLPQFGGSATGSGSAPPPAAPVPAPPELKAAVPVDLAFALAALRLTGGRVGFTDRAVSPTFVREIAPLDVDVRGLTYPALAVARARVDAEIAPQGVLQASGSLSADGGTIELETKDLDLTPFNPYATAYSPYSVANGALSLKVAAGTRGSGYRANSSLTLHDFDIAGSEGESTFQQQFGIPLSVGLALLRDINGNIVLDIPIEGDEQGTRIGIGTIVGGALRSALINALASPLKLAGAVFKDGKVQAVAPTTLAFRTGRSELTGEGAERLEQLAALLTSRPGMGVRLQSAPSTRDAQWLREQALRAKLDNPEGFTGRMRALVRRGSRDVIVAALTARANDEPGEIDAESRETFEQWLGEIPEPSPQDLQNLAQGRLALVRDQLEGASGVAATRIAATDAASGPSEDPPQVRLDLVPVRSLAQVAAPAPPDAQP